MFVKLAEGESDSPHTTYFLPTSATQATARSRGFPGRRTDRCTKKSSYKVCKLKCVGKNGLPKDEFTFVVCV